MFKLLRANLSRLKKDKVFWIALLVMLAYAVIHALNNGRTALNMMRDGYQGYEFLDKNYFNTVPFLGIFISVVISLYLGKEYGDGTLRNKVIVGHTRANIYLANLLTGIVVSASFVFVCLLGGLTGLAYQNKWHLNVSWTILYVLMILLL